MQPSRNMPRVSRRSCGGRHVLGLLIVTATVVYLSCRAGAWLANPKIPKFPHLGLLQPGQQVERLSPTAYLRVPTPDYHDVTLVDASWRAIGPGLAFNRVTVLRAGQEVDTIAVVRIAPAKNALQPITGYRAKGVCDMRTLADWQKQTAAPVVFNSAQYMAEPRGRPCALLKCDGIAYGPDFVASIRGALVSQPTRAGLPAVDLLDFDYTFDAQRASRFSRSRTEAAYEATIAPRLKAYRQVVAHWPILLDQAGRIRVDQTERQARRTVVAKDHDGNLLVLATEGEYFTLYNLGRLLKDDRGSPSPAFDIRTAMNLDGGPPSGLLVNTASLQYASSGPVGGSGTDLMVLGVQMAIPTVICVQPNP